jgi:CRP/FNR family nitrogen fixation transcriptional regulator
MQVQPLKPNGAQAATLPAQTAKPQKLSCDRRAGRSPSVSVPLGDHAIALLVAMGMQRGWAKRQVLYDSNASAQWYYKVTKGIVAECKDLPDGRRQIVALRTVGDICGYPTRKGRYDFTGQAITPVEACAISADEFRVTMERDTAFTRAVADDVAERLNQALIRLTVVGQFCALERVAYFILEMEKRLPSCRTHMGPFGLHLKREEIADYLGLTLETVSRAFTRLRQMELIALDTSDVVAVLDQKRLCEIASGHL